MCLSLAGRVCLVTGATRGFGRGISLQLGQRGATVYVTGNDGADLLHCSNQIRARGGVGVAVIVNHARDTEVEGLFARIKEEQIGGINLLVNNVFPGCGRRTTTGRLMGRPFWETPPGNTWDSINGFGLRSSYVCTALAARMMVKKKSGLIVNVSSFSGELRKMPHYNAAYSAGRAASDRMTADCAKELRSENVAVVSLVPTSLCDIETPTKEQLVFGLQAKTREFSGKAVACLLADTDVMKKSGKVLGTAALAEEYGFADEGVN